MKTQKYGGLILPEHQQSGKNTAVRAIGYILRGAVALLCSFAMSRFVFDCMGAELPRGYVFGVCLALTALFSLMAVNKIFFASGAVLTVCSAVFALQSAGNIVDGGYFVGVSVFNTWCRRLADIGYSAMSREIINISDKLSDIGRTEAQMFRLAAFFMMMLFTAVCVFAVIRRAKAVLILGAYAAFVTVALYFEIANNPLGLSLMLAAVCAVVTLGIYDGVFCKKKSVSAALGTVNDSPASRRELAYTLRANSNLGGYAGALSALAALLIISLTAGISEPMKDIPKISHPAEKIQNYLISTIEGGGDSSLLSADNSVQESRKTTANERKSLGVLIFEVQTDVDIPVYLRSWTGKDYYNDGWHTASADRLEEYRDMFGTGFSHEFLTSELIYAVDPTLYDLRDAKTQDSLEFGFVSSYVHINKKSPSGSLVYMPSYTDQRERLMRFGTEDKLRFGGYENYYDGIFVSSGYIFTDEYTVLARLGLPPTEENVQNIAKLVQHYAKEYELLRSMRWSLLSSGKDISDVREAYPDLATDIEPLFTTSGKYTFPTSENSLSYRYAFVMDENERHHIDALTDNLSLYHDYVYDSYLTVYEHFDSFNSLMRQICQENGIDMRRDAATYDGRHRIVRAVIDYLSENMTYTLSPKAPSPTYRYSNAAATFLFDTKEGYCSQYASAAIMLLRSAGIPARYAEGYIADEFSATIKKTAPGKYISYVADSNAHAWVEVYYDYYGWLTYEATTPYIPEVEPSGSDTGADTDPRTTEREDTTASSLPVNTTTSAVVTDSTDTSDATTSGDAHKPFEEKPESTGRRVVIAVVIIFAAVCMLVIVVSSLKRRGEREREDRERLILRAKEGIFDKAERIHAARVLGDTVMRLLKIKKLSPDKAETASAFGARVDAAIGEACKISFSEVMHAVNAAEFGNDVLAEELTLLASGALYLEEAIMSEAGPLKRAIYKYFGLMS